MEVLHNINDPNVICYTLDLEYTGLHKLFVTTSDPLVAYYSEIDHFDSAWNTHNRNKVWMSDAFINCTNSPSIEWRGCKYVHIVTTTTCKFSIKSLRKEYAFDWISKQLDDDSLKIIYSACQNNLKACVDGGIVDTCWRERAQWVGDAYMSIKALKLLCTNDNSQPVIDNVLRQISQSYNNTKGMVQGAYPIKKHENLDFYMPTYHLLWCLTVLEQNKQEHFSTVTQSLFFWESTYFDSSTNLITVPGWNFVDWFDDFCSGRTQDGTSIIGPNAFVNILYKHLCDQFKIPTKITQKSIDAVFFHGNWYSLYPDSPPSIHATSLAIIYLETTDNTKEKFVDYAMNNGMPEHTMYFGYYIAKAIRMFSKKLTQEYIISKYYPYAKQFGTIIEKITPESSLAHGWSVGIVEFLFMDS
jgi:hypothetical protein